MIAALALMAASDARAARAVCVENATIGELRQALSTGDATAAGLVEAYLARIAAYDRAGPRLDAMREANPDAPAIATQSDAREPATRRPLEGIPILIKETSRPPTRNTRRPARWRWKGRGPKTMRRS